MSFSVDEIRHLYDFPSRYFDLKGHRYHYLDEGRGDPVVMIHGNPTWSFMYRKLVRALCGSHRIIVPDHIGCGLSDKPQDGSYHYTLDQRVNDLEMLLGQLGLNRNVTFVMHDWGGPIGMTCATRRPDRIARLILFNTAAFLLPPGKRLPRVLQFCRDSQLAGFFVRKFNAFALAASYVGCRSRPMPAEVRRAYVAPYNSWDNRIATLRFVQDIPLAPHDAAYATLEQTQNRLHCLEQVPMLICWGEKDFVFDGDFLEEWLRRFPKAEVHRFPEAGHYVLEDAAEPIVALVQTFLEHHPVNSGP